MVGARGTGQRVGGGVTDRPRVTGGFNGDLWTEHDLSGHTSTQEEEVSVLT